MDARHRRNTTVGRVHRSRSPPHVRQATVAQNTHAAVTGAAPAAAPGTKPTQKCSELAKTCLSHALSKVLRHDASKLGIRTESDGFAEFDDVIKAKSIAYLLPQNVNVFDVIWQVVSTSAKVRFTLKQSENGKWKIRANQGHSMKHIQLSELCNQALIPDSECDYIHGTFFKNVPNICEEGY